MGCIEKQFLLANGTITGDVTLYAAEGSVPARLQYDSIGPYADLILADGATGYWPLSDGPGGTTAVNLATGGLDGVATDPEWVGGDSPHVSCPVRNHSACFDGQYDSKYVVPHYAGIDIDETKSFTIEFWLKKSIGNLGGYNVFQKGDGATDGIEMILNFNNDQFQMWASSTTTAARTLVHHYTNYDWDQDPEKWVHFALTHVPTLDNFSGFSLYEDGILLTPYLQTSNMSAADTFGSTDDLNIGGAFSTSLPYWGYMSDFAVYEGVALTQLQVSAHHNAHDYAGIDEACVEWDCVVDVADFPYGAELRNIKAPGCLGRYGDEIEGIEDHTCFTISIDGDTEREVCPNEEIPLGIVANPGATITLKVYFKCDLIFTRGVPGALFEPGPCLTLENQLSTVGVGGGGGTLPAGSGSPGSGGVVHKIDPLSTAGSCGHNR